MMYYDTVYRYIAKKQKRYKFSNCHCQIIVDSQARWDEAMMGDYIGYLVREDSIL